MRVIRNEVLRTLFVFLLVYTLLHAQVQEYAFNTIKTTSYQDYLAIAAPANPAVGSVRWYQNSTTNVLTCLRSDGTDCTPVVPITGAVVLSSVNSCPVGFTEYTALNGMVPLGTTVAGGNVGTTGGSNNITPTGTNGTVAFTPAGTNSAAVFTGSSATSSATSAGTPAGTNGTSTVTPLGTNNAPAISWPAGVPTNSAVTMSGSTAAEAAHTHSVTAAGTNGTVTGPAQVISWPAGVPTNTAITMSGSTAAEASHTHSVTAAGTNGTVTGPAQVISWPAGVPTFAGNALATHAHELPWQAGSGTLLRTIPSGVFGVGGNRAGEGQVTLTANTGTAAVRLSQAVTAGTPAGTIAWPAGVPTNATSTIPAETFTGSAVTSGAGSSHLHAAGTLAASTPTIAWPAGVPTNATSTIPAETFTGSPVTSGAGSSHLHTIGTIAASTPTVSWPAGVPTQSAPTFTGSSSTVAAQVFTGSALATHTHTLTATGTNSAATFTGSSGTVPAETWNGDSFDNRSAFVRVIYCVKT